MGKNVWILNHYAGNTFFEKGGRHYWFAEYLKEKGYNPLVICSNAKHNSNNETYFDNSKNTACYLKRISVPYVFIKSKPYSTNGKDRIINMFDFYLNLLKAVKSMVEKYGKPDIIYASSVHPLTLLAGLKIAKKFKIKCVCEIRDLWPESIIAYGLLKEKSLITTILRKFEKMIYVKADAIVFTMEGGYEYIIERGWSDCISRDKVYYINNGVDLKSFDNNKNKYKISDKDLSNNNYFNIVYTGSIRKVNNLGVVLDVAKNVKNPNIRFLIWGEGDELETLKKRIKNENIQNVIFKGKVDKKYVAYITSQADMNYAHNGQSKMLYYGISFNKLFEYFAAAKPVLCDFISKYNPAVQENAGVSVDKVSVKNIAETIDKFVEIDNSKKQIYGKNARQAAYKYDFNSLTNKLIDIFNKIS